MSLNLFIIGPSGSGKTTQAKLIANKYGLTHFSMGQLLRDEVAKGSGFGFEAKSYLNQGTWVPDDLIFDILVDKLKSINYQNFIIDGFPRVLNQGRIAQFYLKKQGQPLTLVIHLSVPFAEIKARHEKLGIDFQDPSRTDNNPTDIKARQHSYEETIGSIKEYFISIGKFCDIDGSRPVEPIFEDVVKAINSHISI